MKKKTLNLTSPRNRLHTTFSPPQKIREKKRQQKKKRVGQCALKEIKVKAIFDFSGGSGTTRFQWEMQLDDTEPDIETKRILLFRECKSLRRHNVLWSVERDIRNSPLQFLHFTVLSSLVWELSSIFHASFLPGMFVLRGHRQKARRI